MPESSAQCADGPSESPLPKAKSRAAGQEKARLQLPTADAEGGEEPASDHFQTQGQLGQHRQVPVQGPKQVGGRAQEHPCQKASGQPRPYQTGAHRHSPRFRRGSP